MLRQILKLCNNVVFQHEDNSMLFGDEESRIIPYDIHKHHDKPVIFFDTCIHSFDTFLKHHECKHLILTNIFNTKALLNKKFVKHSKKIIWYCTNDEICTYVKLHYNINVKLIQCADKSHHHIVSTTINKNVLYHNYSITFIMTVRNTPLEYLRLAVNSLINQTNNNWQCIIINDGSTDVAYKHGINLNMLCINTHIKHFKIINLAEWHGLIKCHKIGLMHTVTDIVGILDSDDALESCAVEDVLNVYNHTENKNIFVYTNFTYCDKNLVKQFGGYASNVKTCLLSDRCGNHMRTFKVANYFMTNGYDDDLLFGAEDQDILFKIEQYAQPIFLNKQLYNYRVNNNSISSLKKLSLHSYYVSILKNVMARYGNIDTELRIYHKKTKLGMMHYNDSRIYPNSGDTYETIHGVHHRFEIWTNNIYLCNITYDNNRHILDTLLKSSDDVITRQVDIMWSTCHNEFILCNNKLNLQMFCKKHPNIYFDCIYVINLKKDVEKLKRMKQILGKYDIHFVSFDAVYGMNYLSEYNKHNYSAKLKSVGAYGYTLTMLKIFKDAVEKQYKKILVFDDDVILCNDFLNKFDECIRCIPYDWKVLFLGLSGPWSNPIVNDDLKTFSFDKKYITDLFNCDGSYAVGYDLTILNELSEEIKTIKHPFDTQMIEYLNNNPHIQKYAFYPYLVIADTFSSDISVRDENIENNFAMYQLTFRQNLGNFEIDTMLHKQYDKLKRF
jgi:GR25 family glycosyltransferase involved in LPS biosynthesis